MPIATSHGFVMSTWIFMHFVIAATAAVSFSRPGVLGAFFSRRNQTLLALIHSFTFFNSLVRRGSSELWRKAGTVWPWTERTEPPFLRKMTVTQSSQFLGEGIVKINKEDADWLSSICMNLWHAMGLKDINEVLVMSRDVWFPKVCWWQIRWPQRRMSHRGSLDATWERTVSGYICGRKTGDTLVCPYPFGSIVYNGCWLGQFVTISAVHDFTCVYGMNSSLLTNCRSCQYQVISRHIRFQAGVGLPNHVGVNWNHSSSAVHPRLAQSQGVPWQHSTGLPAGMRYCVRGFGPSQNLGRDSGMVRRLLGVAFYWNLICINIEEPWPHVGTDCRRCRKGKQQTPYDSKIIINHNHRQRRWTFGAFRSFMRLMIPAYCVPRLHSGSKGPTISCGYGWLSWIVCMIHRY